MIARRGVVAVAVGSAFATACALFVGDPDGHKLFEAGDGSVGDGAGDASGDGAASGDGFGDGGGDSSPTQMQSCASDGDCTAPNGCYTGHCDPNFKVCVYEHCPQASACMAAQCDSTTSFMCGSPMPYTFHASTFTIPNDTLGCGLNAQACVAAVYPFLFVGTATGVNAYDVSDVTRTTRTKTPLTGLGFAPAAVLVSGRLVYFLSSVTGLSAPYSISVGWLEVPSDPTVASLVASSATLTFPQPQATPFPAPNGGLYLVDEDQTRQFPVVALVQPIPPTGDIVQAPDVPDAGYTMYTSPNVQPGHQIVASSAARLIAFAVNGANLSFSFENAPGTASAGNGGESTPGWNGNGLNGASWGSGPDGSFLLYLGDNNCGSVGSRFAWVVSDAQSTVFDTSQSFVVSPSGCGNAVVTVGPVAWLDAQRALLVQSDGNGQTGVRVATRQGGTPGLVSARLGVLPLNLAAGSRIGAAASNAVGYVLSADGMGTGLRVDLFDPDCTGSM